MINMNSYSGFDFLDKPASAPEPIADHAKANEFKEIFAGFAAAPVAVSTIQQTAAETFKPADGDAETTTSSDEFDKFSEDYTTLETARAPIFVQEKPLPTNADLTISAKHPPQLFVETFALDADNTINAVVSQPEKQPTLFQTAHFQPTSAVKPEIEIEISTENILPNDFENAGFQPTAEAKSLLKVANQTPPKVDDSASPLNAPAAKLTGETPILDASPSEIKIGAAAFTVENSAAEVSAEQADFSAETDSLNAVKINLPNAENTPVETSPRLSPETSALLKTVPPTILFENQATVSPAATAPNSFLKNIFAVAENPKTNLPFENQTPLDFDKSAAPNETMPPLVAGNFVSVINEKGFHVLNREINAPNAPKTAESEIKSGTPISAMPIKGFFTEFTKNESSFETSPIAGTDKNALPVNRKVSPDGFLTTVKNPSTAEIVAPETSKPPVNFENQATFKAVDSELLTVIKAVDKTVQTSDVTAEKTFGDGRVQFSPQMPTNWRVRKNSVAPNAPNLSNLNIRANFSNVLDAESGTGGVKPLPSIKTAISESDFVAVNTMPIVAVAAAEADFSINTPPISHETNGAADGTVKITVQTDAAENLFDFKKVEAAPFSAQGILTAKAAAFGAIEKPSEASENQPAIFFEQLSMSVKKTLKAADAAAANPFENTDVFEQIEKPLLQAAILNGKTDEPEILKLRLRPAELGLVEIKLEKTESGAIKVHFQTENEAARGVLADSFEQLKTSLEKSGWRVEQIEVAAQQLAANNGGERQPRSNDNGDGEPQARRANAEHKANETANFGGNHIESGDLKTNSSNRLLSVRA